MNDLIDKLSVCEILADIYPTDGEKVVGVERIDKAYEAVLTLPSAQPERPKGKWNITDAYPHNVYCSECHKRFAQTHWEVWEDGSLPRNFCPNCGADMRGEQDEQTD